MKTLLNKLKSDLSIEDKHNLINNQYESKKIQRIQRDYALVCASRAVENSTDEIKDFFTLCIFINQTEMLELKDSSAYGDADSSAHSSADRSTYWSAYSSAHSSAYWSTYRSAYRSAHRSAYWSTYRSVERKIQVDIFIDLLECEIWNEDSIN